MRVHPLAPALAAIVASFAALMSLPACSSTAALFGGSATPTLRSDVSGNALALATDAGQLPLRVFAPSKVGVADLYLTDLPESLLREGGDLTTAQGVIVHVHSFVRPRAGKTPIDPDATTAIARVFVLTGDGNAGLYAGGGFFLTNDDPKDKSFKGSLRGATLYLSRATPGFEDLLGPSTLAGTIGATRDESLAARLASVTQTLAENMDAVE
jgi:hypothetical protein